MYENEWDELDDFYPPYLVEGSPAMEHWERLNPSGWKKESPSLTVIGKSEGHVAAQHGDIEALMVIAAENKRALHAKDENGWQRK